MWLCFIFIVMTVLLTNFPVQIKSEYYIEHTENVGSGFKTYLFDCKKDSAASPTKQLKPPIICTLIESNALLTKVYSVKNFFRVLDARLPRNQPIKFSTALGTTLPDSLFLAISYEPLDYPDFLEHKDQYGYLSGNPVTNNDKYRLAQFLGITNLKVFLEDPQEFVPFFRVYMKELFTMTEACWSKLARPPAERKVPTAVQKPRLIEQNKENTRKSCELPKLSEEAEDLISKLLTKMIDPCYIRTMVNGNRIGVKALKMQKLWFSPEEADLHCTTCCKYLAAMPLVLRRGQAAPRCRDLVKGTCSKSTCLCSTHRVTPSLIPKVTMAECNNRIVTIASRGRIQRLTANMTTSWLG